MAALAEIKRLENVTECGICIGDLTDARVLPCVHTFCLKCIGKWSLQNKQTGEKVSCPICREEFEIPEGGAAALPKNDFVEKLLDVTKLSTTLSQGDVVCDVCCDDKESSGEVMKKATVYCAKCRKTMCEECCGHHQKFQLSGVHKLIELNSEINADELLRKFPENVCDKHEDKFTEIYCFDCTEAVCMMCYIESHNSHKCSDIKKVAEDLRKQMSSNAENVATKVSECQKMLKNVDDNWSTFCDKAKETERMICQRADELKQLIEDRKQSLLEQLSEAKDNQLKETMSVQEEVERHQVVLENFIRYSHEVKEKGTACDITKLAGKLKARAEELKKFSVDTIDYKVTEVNFTPGQTDYGLKQNFGNLAINIHGMCKILIRLSLLVCQIL